VAEASKIDIDIDLNNRYHIIMTRTVIALENDVKAWLDQKAIAAGVPMTEIVRQALRKMRDEEQGALDRLLASTSGIWTAGDGLEYQQAQREEWSR
jgi:CHASE3 domain sensor protein